MDFKLLNKLDKMETCRLPAMDIIYRSASSVCVCVFVYSTKSIVVSSCGFARLA